MVLDQRSFSCSGGIDQDGRDDVSKHRKVIQRFDPKTSQMLSETSAEDLENNGIVLLMSYNLDGFVKSPISALRFISCSLLRT
ncbi:MAG: hypothetical protein SRB2_04780 [Desulfobacteraceae bacterium Eth-SRB2]|nr:MAG: hypothetical protein SRB2_04780 [Desulfobacteraceae bacterium Eth-SRB2]